ncbi:DUF1266 domain-containing protein [Spirillospora sp. NPDC050679]
MEPEALEKAVAGSLAEGDVRAVDGVLRFQGLPPRLVLWITGCGLLGVLGLLTGGLFALLGLAGPATVALASGTVVLGLAVVLLIALVAVMVSTHPEVEVRPAAREIARGAVALPFAEVRPEHLVLRKGVVFYRLRLDHPGLRADLAQFGEGEAARAEEFRQGLWALLSRSELTPVQRWIIGAAAPGAAANGLPLDRLGPASETDRDTAHRLLREPWDIDDLDQLLPAVNWLVQDGHRAGFVQDADLADRDDAEREEYGRLLREVDGMIAQERMEPPFVERLVALVRVRYGVMGEVYAKLVPSLLRDEPGADASPEGAELAAFLHGLFNDRDHAAEELHRLKLLADDPALRANVGRFLIWDYSRALLLYRLGHLAGWLTDQYCWDRMLPLALDIQRRYSSWQDMATCYLQGRLLWSGGASQADHEKAVAHLASDPYSPWTQTPWDLTLKRDWA